MSRGSEHIDNLLDGFVGAVLLTSKILDKNSPTMEPP
jgi:hypothetical protein